MDYPENSNTHVFSHEHFRPYLFSRTLRFPLAMKGRPRADWQHSLEWVCARRPSSRNCSKDGFSAIYINRRGGSCSRGR